MFGFEKIYIEIYDNVLETKYFNNIDTTMLSTTCSHFYIFPSCVSLYPDLISIKLAAQWISV